MNGLMRGGVFDCLESEALAAYDRIIELDLADVVIDGSLRKAPCGGQGTGKSPVDRGKLGWKWSLAVDAAGIPIGWAIDGANRNDIPMLEPTLDAIARRGLLGDIDTLHLDRGYDFSVVRQRLASYGLSELEVQRRGTKPEPVLVSWTLFLSQCPVNRGSLRQRRRPLFGRRQQ